METGLSQNMLRSAVLSMVVVAVLLMVSYPGLSHASEIRLSKGQTLYVPVYSNVFSGPRRLPLQLAATLSIRNTDQSASFRVTAIDYYDTNGKLVRRHLERPAVVAPLATMYVHIEEKDTLGGFGATLSCVGRLAVSLTLRLSSAS